MNALLTRTSDPFDLWPSVLHFNIIVYKFNVPYIWLRDSNELHNKYFCMWIIHNNISYENQFEWMFNFITCWLFFSLTHSFIHSFIHWNVLPQWNLFWCCLCPFLCPFQYEISFTLNLNVLNLNVQLWMFECLTSNEQTKSEWVDSVEYDCDDNNNQMTLSCKNIY